MRNFKLTLCYDGSRYKGWQRQGNTENTIQGRLETLLSRLLEQPVEISGSGRTDAGVHARLQVASFHCSSTAIASLQSQIIDNLNIVTIFSFQAIIIVLLNMAVNCGDACFLGS